MLEAILHMQFIMQSNLFLILNYGGSVVEKSVFGNNSFT